MCRVHSATGFAMALLAGGAMASMLGCEQQPKKVLDVKAPGFSLEVEKSSTDSGTGVKIDTGTDGSGTTIDLQRDPAQGTTVDVKPESQP